MKQKIEVELDVPDGYRLAFRQPQAGELCITTSGYTWAWKGFETAPLFVLEPIVTWRDATIEDAVRAIRGETVKARFKGKMTDWVESELVGYSRDTASRWIAANGWAHAECQIMVQPS